MTSWQGWDRIKSGFVFPGDSGYFENFPGLSIYVIDSHTEGEPFRIILNFPKIAGGSTVLELRSAAKLHHDHVRTMLMYEPRGHADMYGGILVDSPNPEADFGVLFTHNEGFSTMCGHGIIALATVLTQTQIFPLSKNNLKIDTPAGLVTAFPQVIENKVTSVKFHNVPSYVVGLDLVTDVPILGKLTFDVAFGGAYYAFIRASDLGVECSPKGLPQLVTRAMLLKEHLMKTFPLSHPTQRDMEFLYGVIVTGPAGKEGNHSRNVCVFADGEVDRSPTGTGVSARVAIHFARGEISLNQEISIESVLGTVFKGSVVRETAFGPHKAVIPQIEGTAHITGRCQWTVDPNDPLKDGFLLR